MEENKKVDLLQVATTFARRKKTILIIIATITIIGFILAFIWPKSYKSEVSFVLTDGNSINFSAGGLISGLAGITSGSGKISADQALVIIRSTAVQDKVIEKFNLQEVYGNDVPESLRKSLDSRIVVEEVREGGIGFNNIIAVKLAYYDGEPGRAHELVEYYYHLVDSTMGVLNKKNVEDGYLLIESRLNQNLKDLQEAEDSLVSFQSKYGILEVEEQAKAQINAIASLRTEIVKLEIQISYLSELMGENSSRISDLKVQKKALDRRYNQMVKSGDTEGEFSMFQPMEAMPALFIEYLRRYREVMVQEEIYKVLYPQFEQQRLSFEEATSGLLVIDPAILPTYKDSPKRAYIIIAAFLFGLILSIIVVLYKEWRDELSVNDPEQYKRFQEFTAALKFKNDKS
ncbi:MAG: GNVR domain-containing protein [Balneolaceae bacterium]